MNQLTPVRIVLSRAQSVWDRSEGRSFYRAEFAQPTVTADCRRDGVEGLNGGRHQTAVTNGSPSGHIVPYCSFTNQPHPLSFRLLRLSDLISGKTTSLSSHPSSTAIILRAYAWFRQYSLFPLPCQTDRLPTSAEFFNVYSQHLKTVFSDRLRESCALILFLITYQPTKEVV